MKKQIGPCKVLRTGDRVLVDGKEGIIQYVVDMDSDWQISLRAGDIAYVKVSIKDSFVNVKIEDIQLN